jgi:lipocalin
MGPEAATATTTTVQLGQPLVIQRSSSEEFPIWATGDLLQEGPSVVKGSSSSSEFPMRPGATVAATNKKRSAEEEEEAAEEAESTTSSSPRKKQRRVRFDAASASSTVTMGMQPVHLAETATDESPGTLWPVVANTPTPNPTIAVTEAEGTYGDHMRSLHNQYDPGSTVSLVVPETDSRGRVKKDSKRRKLAKFFRLDRLRNKFRRTPSPRAAGAVQVESTPELGRTSRVMDVDDEGEQQHGEAMMDEDDGDAVMGDASASRDRGGVARDERVWWGDEPRGGGNAGNTATGERIWW